MDAFLPVMTSYVLTKRKFKSIILLVSYLSSAVTTKSAVWQKPISAFVTE